MLVALRVHVPNYQVLRIWVIEIIVQVLGTWTLRVGSSMISASWLSFGPVDWPGP